MRLLNAKSRELVSFEAQPPPYAILSHTWGKKEVTFRDFDKLDGSLHSSTKIDGSCAQALKDGLAYVWIDTCCIDKTSSSELSEAINSMFQWYRDAVVCYIYLSDVTQTEGLDKDGTELRKSRWFTRGWTLQEFLAPSKAVLYTRDWHVIGSKNPPRGLTPEDPASKDLGPLLSDITGIPIAYLRQLRSTRGASVAARMSWASRRQTTRPEDVAYCLMGLFDVNMPLLYGEGHKAFERLQEEILKKYIDHSLFFWRHSTPKVTRAMCFARVPADFSHCGETRIFKPGSPYYFGASHYVTTNKGLLIQLPIVQLETGDFVARLNCSTEPDESNVCVAIPLVRIYGEENSFYRPGSNAATILPLSAFRNITPTSMYIARHGPDTTTWNSGPSSPTDSSARRR